VRVAYRILGNNDDAEDAVQDAFLSASRYLCGFEGRSALTTWFTRIVVNAALMIRRKSENRALRPLHEFGAGDSVLVETPPDAQPNPESAYLQAESFEFVDALFWKLNPLLREAQNDLLRGTLGLRGEFFVGFASKHVQGAAFRGRRLLQQSAEDITVS
jgi:RNA polymerase sigma factor (sigma-70 family)